MNFTHSSWAPLGRWLLNSASNCGAGSKPISRCAADAGVRWVMDVFFIKGKVTTDRGEFHIVASIEATESVLVDHYVR